jgi:ATP-dependent Lon protease
MRNPLAGGNVLAIQGPMGNGKTTLIKNGVAKALKRPFAFVALGGASDSAYFDGHCYTYEGSRWGRIVDIIQQCKCMNPIICFDELDKVSETAKGDEIINMLIHITDSSQNNTFQDNYFPGVNIDLSKVLFVFSFNDESKINRILKDRMQVIRTSGYEIKDKLEIAKNYLLPEIYSVYNYTEKDITFPDECISYIIANFTSEEKGVRNLKRCLDNLVSIINLYSISANDKSIIDTKLETFRLPMTLTIESVDKLLKKETSEKPPEHMYM